MKKVDIQKIINKLTTQDGYNSQDFILDNLLDMIQDLEEKKNYKEGGAIQEIFCCSLVLWLNSLQENKSESIKEISSAISILSEELVNQSKKLD